MDEEKKNDITSDTENKEVNSEESKAASETDAKSIEEKGKSKDKKDGKKKKSLGREIWEWVYTIAIALAIAFLIKGFVFDIVKVDGGSMEKTLLNGDRLIVTKLGYTPTQGDIIILDSEYKNREEYYDTVAQSKGKEHLSSFEKLFTSTPASYDKKYYVKRVIAMPGQTIDIQGGNVYVDGQKLDEPYANGLTAPINGSKIEYPFTVSEGCVFVMGDHRNASKDSRSDELGEVPIEAILGKSQIRIWPLSDIGLTK